MIFYHFLLYFLLIFVASVAKKTPNDTSHPDDGAKLKKSSESEFISDKFKSTNEQDLVEIQENMTKLGMTATQEGRKKGKEVPWILGREADSDSIIHSDLICFLFFSLFRAHHVSPSCKIFYTRENLIFAVSGAPDLGQCSLIYVHIDFNLGSDRKLKQNLNAGNRWEDFSGRILSWKKFCRLAKKGSEVSKWVRENFLQGKTLIEEFWGIWWI